jgi:hypothetical protein
VRWKREAGVGISFARNQIIREWRTLVVFEHRFKHCQIALNTEMISYDPSIRIRFDIAGSYYGDCVATVHHPDANLFLNQSGAIRVEFPVSSKYFQNKEVYSRITESILAVRG